MAKAFDYNSGVVNPGNVGMNMPIAQGDILLVRREAVPADFEKMKPGQSGNESNYTGHSAILAFGEATGHCHNLSVLDPATTTLEAFSKDGQMFLRIEGGPAVLRHEEHAHIEIPPGTYQRHLQREWDQWQERRVAD